MSRELNLLDTPLRGTNLIEANAGTGKTYNITGLYARMIAELGLPVEKILVVTYTKAAVSDLKSKIYQRLSTVLDAMQACKNGEDYESADPFPAQYAKALGDRPDDGIKRIRDALRDFDQCAIFTIHSFCQRMLTESAFSGRIPYDVEMTGDIRDILKKPVYGFWRKNVYTAPEAVMPYLLKFSPEELTDFYARIQGNPAIEFEKPENFITIEQFSRDAEALSAAFDKTAEQYGGDIKELLDGAYRADWLAATFRNFEACIKNRTHTVAEDDKSLIRLTQSNINEKGKKKPEHEFFRLMDVWYKTAEEFRAKEKDFIHSFRLSLCRYMETVLEEHKLKRNMQSYDDLITRMRAAVLENEGQGDMVRSLHHKYAAALIDEFQDTDPYQYDIFHTAFSKQGKPFFMIGDPKQAIYSFRGADVFAYLKAAGSKANKYTLTDNYRSDPNLVERINGFFSGERPFLLEQIDYSPSKGALPPVTFEIDKKEHPPLTVWQAEGATQEMIALSTARSIAELLNKSAAGNAKLNGNDIKPSDIAVLCRSNKQMSMVKSALAACRVPAVVSGSESVFASDEALEMANLLAAVLNPYSRGHIKTALATPIFGYRAEQIFGIEDTGEWDDITALLRKLNDLINMRGFAPMFFSLAAETGLYHKTAGMPDGERKLTNMIHITELAQKYEADNKADPARVLKWMKERIKTGSMRDDEAELKMDSDENAVTIVTIHKSKGLEYKIVYTPFLMFRTSDKSAKDKRLYKYHDGGRYILSPEPSEMADTEEKAEDIRIAYVALTRAKAACFTAWGDARSADISPLSRIINGEYGKYDAAKLNEFVQRTGVSCAPLPLPEIQTYRGVYETPGLTNRTFGGDIPPIWQINSFSRLVHSSSGVKDTDQFTAQAEKSGSPVLDIFSFPKGAKAGTCLHECMEETRFEDFSRWSVLETVTEKLAAYSFDTEFAPAVTDCIMSILEKKMHGVTLSKLTAYVHEMEFQIASGKFSASDIAEIFRRHGEDDFANAASSLGFEAVNGFMNGFADLVFEHGGRYYILDWKSNHLGDDKAAYSRERMHAEMLGSHYYLQLYIYALALHMHLKNRLPDYDYEKHFGGGLYIFMRGVNSAGMEGIYSHRPKHDIISAMEHLVNKQ